MFSNGHTRVVGACLIALVVSMVVTTMSFGAATGDSDTSRAEIEEFLGDVEDNEAVFGVTIGSQVAQALLGLGVAAACTRSCGSAVHCSPRWRWRC
jgi:hypothetical protein